MITEIPSQNSKYILQDRKESELPMALSPATALGVRAFHRQLPGYKPTPMVRLERLAHAWGFGDIFVKDEAPRFGLNAFKVLGGSYAVARLICQKLDRPLSEVSYAQLVSDEVREMVGQITLATAIMVGGSHGPQRGWDKKR
jgi:diaminopropionate ammonia-lyase